VAEVGLELFQALKTLGIRENMRIPEQSEGSTRQSETKSVDNVLTSLLAHFLLLPWFGT
jgi:hypothetical protein